MESVLHEKVKPVSDLRESKMFGYANVGYFGLAHSLLAWARCRLWTLDHGVPMLAPSWLHIRGRIGPLLRRERDTRQYQKLFTFPGYVSGFRRWYLLLTAQRVKADATPTDLADGNLARPCVVEFENQVAFNSETYFPSIIGRHEEVRQALWDMTRIKHRPARISFPHIAIHVRLGDFSVDTGAEALKNGGRNSRLPMDWYVEMLTGLRARLGCEQIPAIIYSDGSDDALSSLLNVPFVSRAPQQSAVTDLLSMAQASALISSGSGFSQWGAYLGRVPRVCFPGQRFIRVHGDPVDLDLEPECERAAEVHPDLLIHMGSRLGLPGSGGVAV